MGLRLYADMPIALHSILAASVDEEVACLVRASDSLIADIMKRLWSQIATEAAFEASAELAAEIAAQQHLLATTDGDVTSSTQDPQESVEPRSMESGEPSDAPSHRQRCCSATSDEAGTVCKGPRPTDAAGSSDKISGGSKETRRRSGVVSKRRAMNDADSEDRDEGRAQKRLRARMILSCDEGQQACLVPQSFVIVVK